MSVPFRSPQGQPPPPAAGTAAIPEPGPSLPDAMAGIRDNLAVQNALVRHASRSLDSAFAGVEGIDQKNIASARAAIERVASPLFGEAALPAPAPLAPLRPSPVSQPTVLIPSGSVVATVGAVAGVGAVVAANAGRQGFGGQAENFVRTTGTVTASLLSANILTQIIVNPVNENLFQPALTTTKYYAQQASNAILATWNAFGQPTPPKDDQEFTSKPPDGPPSDPLPDGGGDKKDEDDPSGWWGFIKWVIGIILSLIVLFGTPILALLFEAIKRLSSELFGALGGLLTCLEDY